MASHVSSHNTAAVGYSISHVRQKPSEWLVPLRVALLTGKRWHQRRASARRPAGWQQTAALRRCCNPPMANGTGLGFGRARRVLRCVAPRMSPTAASVVGLRALAVSAPYALARQLPQRCGTASGLAAAGRRAMRDFTCALYVAGTAERPGPWDAAGHGRAQAVPDVQPALVAGQPGRAAAGVEL